MELTSVLWHKSLNIFVLFQSMMTPLHCNVCTALPEKNCTAPQYYKAPTQWGDSKRKALVDFKEKIRLSDNYITLNTKYITGETNLPDYYITLNTKYITGETNLPDNYITLNTKYITGETNLPGKLMQCSYHRIFLQIRGIGDNAWHLLLNKFQHFVVS